MSQVFVDFFARTHLMTRLLITVACPAIISRESWFANEPSGPANKYESPPSMVIFHHSGKLPCNTTDSCIVRMLELQRLHQRDRHWFDFGYNFGIGGDGAVYEGRGWDKEPAVAKNYNDKSINIVFLGDFSATSPTPEMMTTAKNLIDCGVRTQKITQDYKLLGYQEGGSGKAPADESGTAGTGTARSLFTLIQSWPHWSSINITAESPTEVKLALLVE